MASSSSSWNGTVSREQFKALSVPDASHEMGGTRRLRVFMSADSPNINLCKSVMSAVALGYPMPVLLDWKAADSSRRRPQWHLAGSHVAKLESWLSAIEELLDNDADADDNDLAVLVDADDIWFQLPPSVLIKRYHQLNREADERVRKQWEAVVADSGADADEFPVQPPRQSIIVTSGKDCSPDHGSGSSPHYEHWPQSPMPRDMYGSGTDRLARPYLDPARKYRKMRPRCVNSGLVMGTMGSLRAALLRSREKIDRAARTGRQLWSDQALLGEVIGEQELWREWVLSLAASWNGTASHGKLSALHRSVRPVAREAMRGAAFEFGIGLDYNFTTMAATCSAEDDGAFVRLANQDEIDHASNRAGVSGPARVQGVPRELRELTEAARQSNEATGPLDAVSWGDVPLYTDLFFGVAPVGVHHNAYVNGLKPWRIANWWERTWFYPKLRHFVMSQLSAPSTGSNARPIAKMPAMHPDGNGIVYMAPESSTGSKSVTVYKPATPLRAAAFEPISWDGVCQKGSKPWYDELFGDNIGPLTL